MNNRIEELLEKTEANFTVEKKSMFLDGGHKVNDFFALIRNDNNHVFQTVTDRYEPFQNSELMEMVFKIEEETDYKFKGVSSYGHGEKIVASLKLKDILLEYPKVGDIVENDIQIRNSHDGTGGVSISLGTLTLSCTNGMTRRTTVDKKTIKHTTNLRTMIDKALSNLDILRKDFISFEEQINRMIGVKADAKNISQMVDTVLKTNISEINSDNTSSSVSTRKINQVQDMLNSIEEEMKTKGANVWGLVSGVTHYTTHKALPATKTENQVRKHNLSKNFGLLANKDNEAFELALEMI